jgi:hypothetical protein
MNFGKKLENKEAFLRLEIEKNLIQFFKPLDENFQENLTTASNNDVYDPDLSLKDSIQEWLSTRIFDQNDYFNQTDLRILCDLFYLPIEHGILAQFLLKLLSSLLKSTSNKELDNLRVYFEFMQAALMPKFNSVCSKIGSISNTCLKNELLMNNKLMSELKMTLILLNNFIRMVFDNSQKWLKNKKLVFELEFNDMKSFSTEIKRLLAINCFKITSESFLFIESNRFDIQLLRSDEESDLKDFKVYFNRDDGSKVLMATFYEDCELEFEEYYAFGLRFVAANLNLLKNYDKNLQETFVVYLKAVIMNYIAYFKTTNYVGVAVSNENNLDKEPLFAEYHEKYFDFFSASIIDDRIAFFYYDFF